VVHSRSRAILKQLSELLSFSRVVDWTQVHFDLFALLTFLLALRVAHVVGHGDGLRDDALTIQVFVKSFRPLTFMLTAEAFRSIPLSYDAPLIENGRGVDISLLWKLTYYKIVQLFYQFDESMNYLLNFRVPLLLADGRPAVDLYWEVYRWATSCASSVLGMFSGSRLALRASLLLVTLWLSIGTWFLNILIPLSVSLLAFKSGTAASV